MLRDNVTSTLRNQEPDDDFVPDVSWRASRAGDDVVEYCGVSFRLTLAEILGPYLQSFLRGSVLGADSGCDTADSMGRIFQARDSTTARSTSALNQTMQ